MKYLRLALPLFIAYFFIILPTILTKPWTTLDYRYRQVRKAVRFVFPLLHIDLTVNHESYLSTKEPYLIISNHHAMLDPFLMIYLMVHPVRFISKKEVRRYPIIGDATSSIDALFINRNDVRSQVRLFQVMKASMAKKETRWVIYPEGTRNRQLSNPMLPMKPGSFKHAMETQTTILPMITFGFHRPINPKIKWKRYPVQVDFLPPITPAMYAGKTTQELADMIQNMMEIASKPLIEQDIKLSRQFNK
jgi:1-acyl-sn-glycerol-3-phosphate acyltransferase